jgi:hypothetical protein
MDGSRGRQDGLYEAQQQLRAVLCGTAAVHVTSFAAACLRAVDAHALNEVLSDATACGRFREIRDAVHELLSFAGGASNTVYPDTLEKLDAILRPMAVSESVQDIMHSSLVARAIAQALHDTRESHFWSYFAGWTEARKLAPGDPFPVPSTPKLYEIYRQPLRLSPCPDTRDTPHGLCPGGYRGLPSLRPVPACSDGEIYLDPSLGHDMCPLTSGGSASGGVAILVPAEDLDERYDYDPLTVDGERVFSRVRPRGSPDEVRQLINDIIARLRRAGDQVTLAMLPELTSTPDLEDAIGAALARGELGHTQLVVAGSSWVPAELATDAPGDNRATIWPRRGDRYHHFKFSWFHHKMVGAEHIVHRRKRITILAGPRLTCTTLICKDALETWVPGILQELRVRLVLVPSCNPGVAAYRPFAMSVSDLGWTTVVLANIPPEAGAPPEYGLVVRPAARVGPGETGHVSEIPVASEFNPLILLNVLSS